MDLEIYRSRARYYAAAFDWSVAHQVEHIASLSGLPKGGSVLEPMCGSARLSKAFAAAGFHTLGVDLSAPLIELARIVLFRRRPRWRMAGSRREGLLPRPGLRFGSVSRQ